MSARAAAWLAWGVWAVYVALMAAVVGLLVLTGGYSNLALVLSLTILPTVGAVVASRRPENPIGWLLLAVGLAWGVTAVASAYAEYALLARPDASTGGVAAGWVATWSNIPALGLLSFVLLRFPTGQLPS